jgi:hypothetical protein
VDLDSISSGLTRVLLSQSHNFVLSRLLTNDAIFASFEIEKFVAEIFHLKNKKSQATL